MIKKSLLWIFLGVAFLAALIVYGSILTNNLKNSTPPVIEAEDFEDESNTVLLEDGTQVLPEEEDVPESSQSETQLNGETSQNPSEQNSLPESAEDSGQSAGPPTAPPTAESQENAQVRIDALIAEVYGLRDYYIAQLAYLETNAQETYDSLPLEEKTPEKKREMALSCIDKAYALENECDSRMDEICTELSYLLLRTDGELNLVNDVRYEYAREKEQAKNLFLEKYADYFS